MMRKSIIIKCPKCFQKLRIPYIKNKRLKIKCKNCGNIFEYYSPEIDKKNFLNEIKLNIQSFLNDIKPYIPNFFSKIKYFFKDLFINLKYYFYNFFSNFKYFIFKFKSDPYYRKNLLRSENSALYILIILILLNLILRLLIKIK